MTDSTDRSAVAPRGTDVRTEWREDSALGSQTESQQASEPREETPRCCSKPASTVAWGGMHRRRNDERRSFGPTSVANQLWFEYSHLLSKLSEFSTAPTRMFHVEHFWSAGNWLVDLESEVERQGSRMTGTMVAMANSGWHDHREDSKLWLRRP